mmetsp:Transcript_12959/g.26285  ORF Transcript_12959/g.26285 Transcript_12959/m.26285 type:complete len:212 (-) Transcript_12959:93-728(-)|eukprot:CAMPEP_0184680572 /NCGR_PEP_ID=MMETSP0312-20130426/3453_1 /TAXON_ID=31354 /ORGANISM="Compsopogon coeruleus, Strain SAG 36.94" /LENGTH=211 /DNA_ID=CAMNT_0027130773 /DNA_START=164 /DNA_END=799 /DNA_ORIENTATION=+
MAFVTSALLGRSNFVARRAAPVVSRRAATTVMEMSPSVPFLEKPARLDDSMAGYTGFDPLGFSNFYDVKYLQEAEIKHCRICMLAALGWVFPELWHLPGEVFSYTNPLEAVQKVPFLGILQILFLVIAVEAKGWDRMNIEPSFEPGNYGFDPLGLSSSPSSAKWYADAEIKNGRLAMIAVGGMIHQSLLTGKGVLAQINAHEWFPVNFPLH